MNPQDALNHAPLLSVQIAAGRAQYRSAGTAAAATHVLLHGIGSASASWAGQLQAAAGRRELRLLAWEAPGYGDSTPLAGVAPQARDYAERLWAWLDALDMRAPVVLVGHSLGALMAASACLLQPQRVRELVLLSPALGYGDASPAERQQKLQSRLDNLQRLGPQGMAAARAAAMLSPTAPAGLVEAVRENMAQIHPAGYTQAAHMLSGATLLRDLAAVRCPVRVASGEADTITPPAGCDRAAQAVGQTRISLGPVGHACALEAASAVNRLLGLDRP